MGVSSPGSTLRGDPYFCITAAHSPGRENSQDSAGERRQRGGSGARRQTLQHTLSGNRHTNGERVYTPIC